MHTIDLANPSSNLPQNRRSCRADEGKSAAIIRIKLTVIFASLTSFQLSIDFQAFFSKSVIDVFRSFETLGSMLKRSTPHGFCDQRQFKPKFKTLSGPDYFVPAGQVKLSAIIDRFGLFYDPSHWNSQNHPILCLPESGICILDGFLSSLRKTFEFIDLIAEFGLWLNCGHHHDMIRVVEM